MVECFHTITIDAKRLHFRCAQYCIILPSRNKSFSRNPFEFLHIRESLVSRSSGLDPRDLRLDTRDSILERFEHRGSRIESRGSSFECQLTFERYCMALNFRFWCIVPSRVSGTGNALASFLVCKWCHVTKTHSSKTNKQTSSSEVFWGENENSLFHASKLDSRRLNQWWKTSLSSVVEAETSFCLWRRNLRMQPV